MADQHSDFKNTVILKQLGITIGIPFGLSRWSSGLRRAKASMRSTGWGLSPHCCFSPGSLSWRSIVESMGRVRHDGKCILCRTQAKQAKKNRTINALTVVLGLLSGKPAAAGAGMLAQSRQEVSLRWNRVTRVKYKPKSRTILLRGAGRNRSRCSALIIIMNRSKLLCV